MPVTADMPHTTADRSRCAHRCDEHIGSPPELIDDFRHRPSIVSIECGRVGVLVQIQRPELVFEFSNTFPSGHEPVPRLRVRLDDWVEDAPERSDHRQRGSIRALVDHTVEFPPADRSLARERDSQIS